MRKIIKDSKLAIIRELQSICFDLSEKVENNLKHKIDWNIRIMGF